VPTWCQTQPNHGRPPTTTEARAYCFLLDLKRDRSGWVLVVCSESESLNQRVSGSTRERPTTEASRTE
jgi:hypothetical protein